MKNTKVFAEMTKAEKFGAIAEVAGVTEEMREFLAKEIEAIRKKNSYKSKADKEKSAENIKIENAIVEVLKSFNEPMTTAQIAMSVGSSLNAYVSTQRIVPRCKALVESGNITVAIDKKVTKYKVAE